MLNPKLVASPKDSRSTIMAELARVLRDAEAGVDDIESAIARTSASSQEISAEFGSSRELLLAMVCQLSDSMAAPLALGPKADPLECLVAFGRRVIDIHADSHLRAVYRIAINESLRRTGLGREFYEVGLGRLTRRLAEFIQIAQANGTLRRADPHLLASHFLSLLRANLGGGSRHGLATGPITGGAYSRDVADLFCRGINGGRESH